MSALQGYDAACREIARLRTKLVQAEAERDALREWRKRVFGQRVSVFGLTTFLNEIGRKEWAGEVSRLLSAIEAQPGGEE